MLGLGDAKGRLSGGDVIVTWHVAATSAPRSSHAALLQPTVQQLHGDNRVAHRSSIAVAIGCNRSAALDVRARSARLFAMCPAPCGRRRVSTCVSKVPLLPELPRHWRQRASAARVHQGQGADGTRSMWHDILSRAAGTTSPTLPRRRPRACSQGGLTVLLVR